MSLSSVRHPSALRARRAARVKQCRRQFIRRLSGFEPLENRVLLARDFLETAADDAFPGQAVQHFPAAELGVVDSRSSGATITAGDTDFYNFVAAVAGDIVVTLKNNGGDPDADTSSADIGIQLQRLDNVGADVGGPIVVATSGGAGTVTIPAVAAAAPFWFKVLGTTATNDANYQLTIQNRDVEDDAGGNNNKQSVATPLGTVGSIPAAALANHTITSPDFDFYSFTSAAAPATLSVSAVMPTGSGAASGVDGPTNLGVRIRNSAGTIIASSGGTTTAVDTATFAAAASTVYIIEIYSGSLGQVNRYDLAISTIPAATGTISGFKFSDLNNNGMWDEDEPPVQNVTIRLDINNDGLAGNDPSTVLTAANGFYQFTSVPQGVHAVSETIPAGNSQTLPGGPNFNYVVDINTNDLTLDHLDFGNLPLSSITITKDSVPNDAQDFAFTTTGAGLANFNLDDDADGTLPNAQTFSNLVPGVRTVAEGAVAAFTITNIFCTGATNSTVTIGASGGFDPGDSNVSIALAAGENVSCTFVNTKKGHIIVIKDAVPNDAQDFTFTNNFGNGNPVNFSLDDDADGTLLNSRDSEVLPGTYGVSEAAVAGWDPTSATCSDGSPINAIVVSPGEIVTCTFVNTKRGHIIIVKDAVPNDAQDFSFTNNFANGNPANFSLDDDADGTLLNSRDSEVLPGTFAVSEAAVAGWDLTSATCSDGSPVNAIVVSPGESVTCTFVNTKRGHIVIVKDSVPDDPQDFSFTNNFANGNPSPFSLDDDADGTLPNSRDSEVLPGTFSVTEAGVAGWDLTSASCSDGSPVNAIVVSPGETVTCTFVNTKRGHIIIVKDSIPDDPQDFSFTNNFANGNPSPFLLDDDADGTLSNSRNSEVLPGTYAVTEAAVAGWDPTSATCSDGSPVNAINVSPGETVTCTFVNTKRGHIIILKDAQPNDAQDFSFTNNFANGNPSPFLLDDDADGTLTNSRNSEVLPGTYAVTEAAVAGWDASSATCSDGSPVNAIVVSPGETVTCTFVNTKRGHIILVKDAIPNDAQDFSFTNNFGNGNPSPILLDDDADGTLLNSRDSEVLPGTYAVSEAAVAGWDPTSATCSDGSPVNAIVVSAGETVTCTFVNTKRGHVIIVKDSVPNDPQDFSFTNNFANGNPSPFLLDDDADGTLLNNRDSEVLPGTYNVSEAAVAGWTTTSSCNDGSPVNAIVVSAGETVTCTFVNTKQGSITIIKDAVPNSAQDFAYTASGAGVVNFTLDDDADGTLSNTQNFPGLLPGIRTITETVVAGFTLSNIICTGATSSIITIGPNGGAGFDAGDNTVTINLAAGENVSCTFVNTAVPAFTGRKFNDVNGDTSGAGDPGLGGWTIQAYRDVDNDGVFEPNVTIAGVLIPGDDGTPVATTVTIADGTYVLGANSLPNGRYFIREVQQPGWAQTTAPTVRVINAYVSGTTVAGQDFGNQNCTDTLNVADGLIATPFTVARSGIFTVELFTAGTFSVTKVGGGSFQVYTNAGIGSLAPAAPSANSRVSEFDATHQRMDIKATAGEQYLVTIAGSGGASTLRVLNAVNVNGSLVLQVTGSACGEAIIVKDDPLGGATSDAKRIFIGGVFGTYNVGAPLTFDGIQYNARIVNAMFVNPTISSIDIVANAGDDIVRVGDEIKQQSTINAGAGNDLVRVGLGRGTVTAGTGDDFVFGGNADDVLNGDAGRDFLFGLGGSDRLDGGADSDWLAGGAGNDPVLNGGSENDFISGGAGTDTFNGGVGSDTAYIESVENPLPGSASVETSIVVPAGSYAAPPTVPSVADPVNLTLSQMVDEVWNDAFLTDADDDVARDTIDELFNFLA